ncbi:MAG TPA: UDP-2,3-diacylglucosamine diphosphatase [Gammaproteobacteria bacterium]|nr:UDP-2,3-diacylglucosamine diphosphatase [Gammaproteobacteria bacterium]
MATLFISDLHLSPERPDISDQFHRFLDGSAREAEALYILGDLFEVWLGDDLVLPEYRASLDHLRALTKSGVPVYVMHGNRDFLMGEQFCRDTGCRLIDDPTVIDLYGTPTLLMHGDTLCTDDTAYQEFRRMVRDPAFQKEFLAKSVEERIATARQYRETSQNATAEKSEEIMDVNQAAVIAAMQQAGVTRLIHGHTHRPAFHQLEIDGKPAQRFVLGDWYEQGSMLLCSAEACKNIRLPTVR